METKQEAAKTGRVHSLHLEGRKKAVITGVEEVVSMTETAAQLKTGAGGLLLGGKGMHVIKFSSDEGVMVIEGAFEKAVYSGGESDGGKGGLFKRLFK